MDELRLRLERLVQEGSAATAVPSASGVRRHARRYRRRQATGALLGGVLLAAVALGPGREVARWLQDTAASAPATGTPQPTASPSPATQPSSAEESIRNNGRPVSPLVVAAQGDFQGTRWEYLAYRTDRGKVCSVLNTPAYTQHLQRLGARGLWQLDGHWFILGSNCGGTLGSWDTGWNLGGFSGPDHRMPIMLEAQLPATTASVRFEIAGRPQLLLRPAGRKVLNRSFIMIVLPDVSKVRTMVEYDERGRVLHRWRARFSANFGLDFEPAPRR